ALALRRAEDPQAAHGIVAGDDHHLDAGLLARHVEREQLAHQSEGDAGRCDTVEPLALQGHVGGIVARLEDGVLLLEVEDRPRGDRDHELAIERNRHGGLRSVKNPTCGRYTTVESSHHASKPSCHPASPRRRRCAATACSTRSPWARAPSRGGSAPSMRSTCSPRPRATSIPCTLPTARRGSMPTETRSRAPARRACGSGRWFPSLLARACRAPGRTCGRSRSSTTSGSSPAPWSRPVSRSSTSANPTWSSWMSG